MIFQIDTRGNVVLMHIRNLLKEMVSEEQNLKTTMLSKIEKCEGEILDLSVKLHVPVLELEEDLTIMQKEKTLRYYTVLNIILTRKNNLGAYQRFKRLEL